MPTPFFQSAGAGRFQEIPKLLSGQEKLGADVAVVEWIIETARPLTVSQHKKFRKMMEACSAGRYHGPCYQTVLGLTMQLSENGKDAASTFLNRLMTDGTKSVVGADFWSSSGHALLGITGHGISSAWVLQFVLIGAILCSSTSHTADLVDELLDESFRKLGFHDAQSVVFTSVSDNGSNMVAGLSAGGRFPCVCHTLELSVKKGCDIPEISCVLKKSSKLVAHFGRSTISANKLKEHQLRAALKRKQIIKMVLTRWRSHRDMSASIVMIRPALVAFFQENDCLVEDEADPGKYLKMHLGTTDFKILDQFSGMLETMAQASQICEGDKYPTIGAALTAFRLPVLL